MASFQVHEVSDAIREANKLAIYSILGLFCVLLLPLSATAAQKSFADFLSEKRTYEIIQGQEVEVCQVYYQNLVKRNLYPHRYPHRIHQDLEGKLIHARPEEWRLLDQNQYELLYLRVYNLFQFKYQHFFDSYEEVDTNAYTELNRFATKKSEFNFWHTRELYLIDVDVNNDGEQESLIAYARKNTLALPRKSDQFFTSMGPFLVVNLNKQEIDESISKHLLLPRLSLELQYADKVHRYNKVKPNEKMPLDNKDELHGGYSYRRGLRYSEVSSIVFQLQEKGHSDEEISVILRNSVFPKFGNIADDFFTYRDNVYITRKELDYNRPTKNLFRIYKTENDQTEEVCIFKYKFPKSRNQ